MELKEGTISHLQEYIENKIKEWGFEDESINERLLMLSEEVGEIIRSVRKSSEVGQELVDALNMIIAISVMLDIDLEEEYLNKVEEIENRLYERNKT